MSRLLAAVLTAALISTAACGPSIVESGRSAGGGPDHAHPRLVWTATTGTNADISDLSFSPDGRTLAVAGTDVTLWDVAARRLVARLPCDDGDDNAHVLATAFSPDGRTVAMTGVCSPDLANNVTLRLFDAADDHLIATLPDTTDHYTSLAFSPVGPTLLASGTSLVDGPDGSFDSSAIVTYFDPVHRRAVATTTVRLLNIIRMALSPDGRTAALAETNGDAPQDYVVQLLDVAARRITTTLATNAETNDVAFSPDGRLMAATDLPDAVQLWNVAGQRQVRTLVSARHNAAAPFMSVAFSPDGRVLVVGDFAGGLTFWDVASGRLLGTAACGCHSALLSLAYNRNGTVLAAGTGNGRVVLWTP